MIIEARSRFQRPDDIEPILTGSADESDDFSGLSDAEVYAMAGKVLAIGDARKEQLDSVIRQNGAGDYVIPNAHKGQYADFYDQVNYEYLHEKYPWLHADTTSIGIADVTASESHGSLEKFLASVPHEDWSNFLTDVEGMKDYHCLDDDRASELEMEESGRWLSEEGIPELVDSLVKNCDDSYEAYLLSKVTPDMVFEWSRETVNYPEPDNEGGVYMDMGRKGADRENQEWFLDHIDDDVAGWLAIKRAFYDEVISKLESGLRPKKVGDQFDLMLREMATEDEQIATVYNHIDAATLWQMFLEAFPDERRNDDDPYWFRWRPDYAYEQPYEWKAGYEPESGSWITGYAHALAYLRQAPWFRNLIANWLQRGPEGHPEFRFESVREALEPDFDPDDPETFLRHGGGLRETLVYEDDNIVAMYPRDRHTLNFHLLRLGYPEVTESAWNLRWSGNDNDPFVVLAKQEADLLGHGSKREIGFILGDTEKVVAYNGTYSVEVLNQLLSDPRYGRSIRRMLLRYFRDEAAHNWRYGAPLLQLGGPRELRRLAARGDFNLDEFAVEIGIYYVDRHKYGLAAKAFNRPPATLSSVGVWLIFDGVEDLLPVFKNKEAAETVFNSDHFDWFSHFWDKHNHPAVSDVTKFLSPAAIQHIREVLVNRRVWFPDGGPDGNGEYVLLTKKLLDGYSDDEILDWIQSPSDQDEEDGVFEDIREAIERVGIRLLEQASVDNVFTGFIKAAVDAIDGVESKWGSHPTKKTKYGPTDTFEVLVRWKNVKHWATDYHDNNGNPFEGSLEELATTANADSIEPDASNMEASWHDVEKENAAEMMDEIFELQQPELEPLPEAPGQTVLPLGEAEDEEARAQAMMKEYGVEQPDYDLAAAEKQADDMGQTQRHKANVARDYLRKMRGESVDDLDSPEKMPNMLSGIPVEFERRAKAILADLAATFSYTMTDLSIRLEPYAPPSPEAIDASDGRLNRQLDHASLIIQYRTDPESDYDAQREAYIKLRADAVNVFRKFTVTNGQLFNPSVLNLSPDWVIISFVLFPLPDMEPPDEAEIPF